MIKSFNGKTPKIAQSAFVASLPSPQRIRQYSVWLEDKEG